MLFQRSEIRLDHKSASHTNLENVEDRGAGKSRVDSFTIEATGQSTVSALNSLYGIPSNTGSSSVNQSVFSTGTEYFSPVDLNVFQRYYGLRTQAAIARNGHSSNYCGTTNVDCFEGKRTQTCIVICCVSFIVTATLSNQTSHMIIYMMIYIMTI